VKRGADGARGGGNAQPERGRPRRPALPATPTAPPGPGQRTYATHPDAAKAAQLMAELRKLRDHVEKNADYVGGKFAEDGAAHPLTARPEKREHLRRGERSTRRPPSWPRRGSRFARVPLDSSRRIRETPARGFSASPNAM
jgi:hypothetical protein